MKGSFAMRTSTVRRKKVRVMRYYEFTLMFLVLFTCAVGLVVIYSSSYYIAQSKGFKATHFLIQQAIALVIGIVMMLILSLIDFREFGSIWKVKRPKWLRQIRNFDEKVLYIKIPYVLLFFSTVLQFYTTFFTEGANGARRWITIGRVTIQPSEIAKFVVIIFGAYVCSKYYKEFHTLKRCGKYFLHVAPLILLIAIENLSSAIIVFGIFMMICFATSDKYSYFIGIGIAALLAIYIAIKMKSGFRNERLNIFNNLEGSEHGQQILQGIYAIASGGLFGKGLGGSEQKYGRVPEAYNDMIYTVICEEFGLFGGIAIVLLFIFIIFRILIIAINTDNRFGKLIGIGVIAQIAIQVVLNIAVVTNTVPSTGVALPFISYGGTSVIMLLCEIGVILNISGNIEYRR